MQQWTAIQELARQGLNISDIQRETGFAWNPVKKYLAAPRKHAKPQVLDPLHDHLRSRLAQCPRLTARRLFHEARELGYTGGETRVKDFVRTISTDRQNRVVWRFETPPGEQAQVDWAHLRTMLVDGRPRRVSAFVGSVALPVSQSNRNLVMSVPRPGLCTPISTPSRRPSASVSLAFGFRTRAEFGVYAHVPSEA